MNIAAQIKNIKKQSKYVVNLSFDIPIESHRLLNDQPVSGQFTISQLHPKKNLKIKIGSVKTSQQPLSNRLSAIGDSNKINSSRNDKKSLTKVNNKVPSNTYRHTKNLSCPHSKSPSRIGSNSYRQAHSVSQSFNIKALKNKIICSVDDDIVGYTNPSSELKKQQKLTDFSYNATKPKQKDQNDGKRSPLMTPPLKQFKSAQFQQCQLLSQIKKIQKNAIEKRKQLNYQYIRQKILMQACARKIQRAWRNYKTKKLIRTYSHTLSIKYSNKMSEFNQPYFKQPKILNVKSCGFKNGENQMKKKLKQTKQFFQQQKSKQKQQSSNKQQTIEKDDKNQIMKQLQIDQIKKWQQFIKQLRENRNVDQMLNNINKRKQELGRQQQIDKQIEIQIQDKSLQLKEQQKLKNTISKIENEQTKKYIQNTINILEKGKNKAGIGNLTKINTFSQQKSQSERKQQQSISPKSQQIRKSQKQQNIQTIKPIQKLIKSQINKQQQTSSMLQQMKGIKYKQSNQKIQKQSLKELQKVLIPHSGLLSSNLIKPTKIKNKQNIYSQKLATQRDPQIINLSKNRIKQIMYKINDNINQNQRLPIQQQADFILNTILNDLFSQFVFQSRKQVRHLKTTVIANKQKNTQKNYKSKYVSKSPSKDESQPIKQIVKPEGICTNMDSIKDYLENLISYIFEQHPQLFIQNFNKPKGMNCLQILQQFKKIDKKQLSQQLLTSLTLLSTKIQQQQKMLQKNLFYQHWSYASQQIYFQRKHEDSKMQQDRVNKLKNITEIFFAAIFDSYNQCLQYQRIYGKLGYPYPWQTHPHSKSQQISTLQQSKPKIKAAFKKLSDISLIFCGLMIEDKRPDLSPQMINDIKQERLKIYIQNQIKQTNYNWQHYQNIQAYIMYKLSNVIFEILVIQLFAEIKAIQHNNLRQKQMQ